MAWSPQLITGTIGECQSCPVAFGDGSVCVGTITPLITELNNPSFGEVDAGLYVVRYCYGAWNYRDGYVVTKVPALAEQTWPNQVLEAHFLVVQAGGVDYEFDEVYPTGYGYATPAEAVAAMYCKEVKINHSGGEIKLHFSDLSYVDNFLDPGGDYPAPTYGLYRLFPITKYGWLRFNCTTAAQDIDTVNGEIAATFQFENLTDTSLNLTMTMAASGGVVTPSAPTTVTFTSHEVKELPFTFYITPGKPDAIVTFTIVENDGYGDSLEPITIDLSALPLLEWRLGEWIGGDDYRIIYNITNLGNGPSINAQSTITPVGNTIVYEPFGSPENPLVLSDDIPVFKPSCSADGADYSFFARKDPSTNKATFTYSLTDGSLTHVASETHEFTW